MKPPRVPCSFTHAPSRQPTVPRVPLHGGSPVCFLTPLLLRAEVSEDASFPLERRVVGSTRGAGHTQSLVCPRLGGRPTHGPPLQPWPQPNAGSSPALEHLFQTTSAIAFPRQLITAADVSPALAGLGHSSKGPAHPECGACPTALGRTLLLPTSQMRKLRHGWLASR